MAQNVADLYRERVHTREVERFRVAHQNILAKHWNEFVSVLKKNNDNNTILKLCMYIQNSALNCIWFYIELLHRAASYSASATTFGNVSRSNKAHYQTSGQAY